MKKFSHNAWVAVVSITAAIFCYGSENDTLITALNLTKYVQPEFPARARLEGIPCGNVSVVVNRTATGEPSDLLILETSHPSFAEAAREAVQQWRFTPQTDAQLQRLKPALLRFNFKYSGVIYINPTIENQLAQSGADKASEPIETPSFQELDQQPKAISQKMPDYPVTLRQQGTEGKVNVIFYVDEEGRVRMPRVVAEDAPEFGEAALAAVSHWRFEQPQRKGRPVVAREQWTFQFRRNS